MPGTSDLHLAAVAYAEKGTAVLPLQPRGKTPATASGVKQATTDTAIIERWWTSAPNMNVGIATGSRSGIFVLDVDDEAGEQSLRELERANGDLPETVEAITGKGRHIYFRLGDGDPIRNSVGTLGPGLDVRGDEGYVVAPPSIHPSGRRYEWSVDCAAEYADAPDWLHRLMAGSSAPGKGKPLEHWHATLTEPIPNGTRNSTLAEICGKLLFHDVNLVLVRDLLVCVNAARCDPPLTIEEVETITVSVARTHLRNAHE
jgi:hypothetical protein